jgi:hypothetical protein
MGQMRSLTQSIDSDMVCSVHRLPSPMPSEITERWRCCSPPLPQLMLQALNGDQLESLQSTEQVWALHTFFSFVPLHALPP